MNHLDMSTFSCENNKEGVKVNKETSDNSPSVILRLIVYNKIKEKVE